MKNNNQAIIRKLTKRILMSNKSRNIVTIIVIAMTAILLTAIATIGISLQNSYKQMDIEQTGYDAHGYFQYLTDEDTKKIIKHPSLTEYGVSKIVTGIYDGIFALKGIEMRWTDEIYAKRHFSTPTTGELPQGENEIAVENWVLDSLGVEHKLGETVHLDFSIGDISYSHDFKLCGFWDNEKENSSMVGFVFVSKPFANKVLEGINPSETRQNGDYYGVNQVSVMFNSNHDLQEQGGQILSDTGLIGDAFMFRENQALESSKLDLNIILPFALVILIVMLSGYLLIYNIFYISVTRDIHFYGLLKTIGTTGTQMKKIIMNQAMLLALIGIPIGLIIGGFLGFKLVPFMVNIVNLQNVYVTINPFIFIISAVFTWITVLISCNKPGWIAASISPVEAIRYTDVSNISNKKYNNSKKGVKLWLMSFRNIKRGRKKFFLTIASLSISFILFNIAFTYVNSYDVNKFLSKSIKGDFVVAHSPYFNVGVIYDKENTTKELTEDVCNQIESIDGVKGADKVFYDEITTNVKEQLQSYIQLYGYEENWWNLLEDNVIQGSFDRDKFATGKYIIIVNDALSNEQGDFNIIPGDIVSFDIDDTSISYEVMAVMGEIDSLYAISSHYRITGYPAYLPSKEFTKILPNTPVMSVTVQADTSRLSEVHKELQNITYSYEGLHISSRQDFINEFNEGRKTSTIISFILCLVIALIGIMNFANTAITNILSRRQEIAMLESIGMTKKQLKQSLIMENVYYVFLTLVISIAIGLPLSYTIIGPIGADPTSSFSYNFSAVPILLYFLVLLVIAYIVSVVTYRNVSFNTVVERLREIG